MGLGRLVGSSINASPVWWAKICFLTLQDLIEPARFSKAANAFLWFTRVSKQSSNVSASCRNPGTIKTREVHCTLRIDISAIVRFIYWKNFLTLQDRQSGRVPDVQYNCPVYNKWMGVSNIVERCWLLCTTRIKRVKTKKTSMNRKIFHPGPLCSRYNHVDRSSNCSSRFNFPRWNPVMSSVIWIVPPHLNIRDEVSDHSRFSRNEEMQETFETQFLCIVSSQMLR